MESTDRKLEQVIECLGETEFINELTQALTTDELEENLDYIIRNHDLNIDED